MISNFFSACQSSVSLPMDLITGWLGAWSLTRLSQKYTGAACTVRRSSDNATTDVSYDSQGKISTSSAVSAGGDLGTWASSDTIFITSMVDLSGNFRNFATATASFQPQLVLNAINGQAVARFSGAQRLTLTSALNTEFNSFFCLHNIAASSSRGVIMGNFQSVMSADNSSVEKNVANHVRLFWGGADLVSGLTNPFSQNQVSSFLRNTVATNTTLWEGNTVDNSVSGVNGAITNSLEHGMGADQRNANPVLAIPLTGDISTIMIYNSVLTNSQRTQISRSLGSIGGLNV